ncbi:MAG: hypothetical protein ACKVP0_08820 [Pirellulaceae bacterium]
MRRNILTGLWLLTLVFAPSALLVGNSLADDFVPPPVAEREAMAAISKAGGRAQVDGDYRVTRVILEANATNDDLKLLAACERLNSLQIGSPKITDTGIEHLKGLTKLTSISIVTSGMTNEGLAALRAALPNCRITPTDRSRSRVEGGGPPTSTAPWGVGLDASRFGLSLENRFDQAVIDYVNNVLLREQDKNGDGFIDKTEWTSGNWSKSNPPANSDLNKDEKLSRDELCIRISTSRGFPIRSEGTTSRASRTTLARNVAVQDDLKLTPEQRQQIATAVESTTAAAIARAVEAKVIAVLTPEQLARLKQIELQQVGVLALLQAETALELKLTDDQKTSLGKLRDEAAASFQSALTELRSVRDPGTATAELNAKIREKTTELTKVRDEKMLAVLSDEQRKSWQEMLGPKGPEMISMTDQFARNRVPAQTYAEAAKTVFTRYDRDNNGILTDEEYPTTVRSRGGLDRANTGLKFPAAREDFEKAYIKYLEGSRQPR